MFSDFKWLDLVQWLFTLAIGLFAWLRKPGEDATSAVQQLRELHSQAINDHATRLTKIEAHMEHIPDEGDFRRLEGQVNEVAQGLQGIRDNLAPIRTALARIEDFLLKSRLP